MRAIAFDAFSKRPKFNSLLVGGMMVLLVFAAPCRADVLFSHDYRATEFFLGEQEADLLIGYTAEAMLIDKKTRYTGSWMKRFFGKVKEQRDTTHFRLDQDQIREIDWYKGKVVEYPFAKLADITWIKQQQKTMEGAEELLKERYDTLAPQLSITVSPAREKIGEYLCIHVEALLRLETVDKKKHATSVTLVKQNLWVSDSMPGYDTYLGFQTKLARRLGLDAERLGSFSYILRYWPGSLDPIRDSLAKVRGYPVKSTLTVEAQYTSKTDTDAPKLITKRIKEENVALTDVRVLDLEMSRFAPPAEFHVERME